MSSSDIRIIKDAKMSRDPVVIAMHKFVDLDVAAPLGDTIDEEDSRTDNEHGLSHEEENLSHSFPKKTAGSSADKIITEAMAQSETLKAAAEREIARMKAQAMEEATELKLQAVDEGKKRGLEEAQRQINEKLQQTTEGCNSMVSAALQEARQIVLEADHQIIDLVLAIARKVVFDSMEDRPELILGIVKSALGRVRDQSQINIHVSLDDYERVLQARRDLQVIVGADRVIAVTADSMLGPGGCLIETSFGTVEAGVDTQLESIRKALLEMLP